MNQNIQSGFLSPNNENKIKNHIMTELSKQYNIQPMIRSIDEKIVQIMKHVSENISYPKNMNKNETTDYLNKVTIEQSINGFMEFLKPYMLKSKIQNESSNVDVNSEYEKLMKEREYTPNRIINTTKSITDTPNNNESIYDELLTNYNIVGSDVNRKLTSIPEELDSNKRRDNFNNRIMDLKSNRMKLMEDRNLVELERNKMNEMKQMGHIDIQNINTQIDNQEKINYNSDNKGLNNITNVGDSLIDREELVKYRYDEYKPGMKYGSFDRQFIISSKDRRWYGNIENNIITAGLEQYRYRFGINNNKTNGIYLQNRQKNVSAIRITTIYISMNELESLDSRYIPPFIYVYIPELENRIETSSINRKNVFAILTLDDRINGQLKYVNFMSANYYINNPISELSNMTVEILNPLGFMYNDSKDNIKIKSLTLNDLDNPKYIILHLDKFIKSSQYPKGDILIVKNYGSGLVNNFTNFMNRETGHFILSNPDSAEFVDTICIDIPKTLGTNGLYTIEPYFLDIIQQMVSNQHPYSTLEGNIMNMNLQPVVIFEISKLEPKSKTLTQNNITLI